MTGRPRRQGASWVAGLLAGGPNPDYGTGRVGRHLVERDDGGL